MRMRECTHSLRFKITAGLLLAVLTVLAVTSTLRYISFRQLLMQSLELSAVSSQEVIEAQLAAYVRSRVILSAISICAADKRSCGVIRLPGIFTPVPARQYNAIKSGVSCTTATGQANQRL